MCPLFLYPLIFSRKIYWKDRLSVFYLTIIMEDSNEDENTIGPTCYPFVCIH